MLKISDATEVAPEDPRAEATLRLSRTFAAPREQVFDAFVEADAIRAYWGPEDYVTPEVTMDVRPGGGFRFGMRPVGAEVTSSFMVGRYREVRRPEHLSFTFSWEHGATCEGEEGAIEGEMLVTIDFIERDGETEVVLVHERHPSREAREGHERGWTSQMVCLDAYLRGAPPKI